MEMRTDSRFGQFGSESKPRKIITCLHRSQVYSARRLGAPHRKPCLLITAWIWPPKIRFPIETHLAACDFCGAELQLLNRYCDDAGEYSFVEMPSPLRRLAEDLLKNSADDD